MKQIRIFLLSALLIFTGPPPWDRAQRAPQPRAGLRRNSCSSLRNDSFNRGTARSAPSKSKVVEAAEAMRRISSTSHRRV